MEKDESRKSSNPARNTDRQITTAPAQTSQRNFYKNTGVDMSAENVSTRQYTGEGGDKEGLRLSNASSPVNANEISNAELIEIIAQLRRVNEVNFLFDPLFIAFIFLNI